MFHDHKGRRRRKAAAAAKGRGNNFSKSEVDLLLKIWEKHLPQCQNERQAAADEYNKGTIIMTLNVTVILPERFPTSIYPLPSAMPASRTRDAASLEGKFKKLRTTQKPTGCATMPPEVKRAKDIQKEIENRQSVSSSLTFDLCFLT